MFVILMHCDGDDGGIDNDGYDTFDTSEVINTILTNPETGTHTRYYPEI